MLTLTLSVTMKPTKSGAMMDIILAAQFVIPMRVPAKFGAKSI